MRDPPLAARAEIIREKGTNRSAFLRGEVDKYTWVAEGSSYILSDLLAAILDAQLDKFDEIQERRAAVARAIGRGSPNGRARERRADAAEDDGERKVNDHLFFLLFPNDAAPRRRHGPPEGRGVLATFHYVPLHSSPFGRALGAGPLRAAGHRPGGADPAAPPPSPLLDGGGRGPGGRGRAGLPA